MVTIPVAEAFALFALLLERAGLNVQIEGPSEASGNRTARCERDGGELRLVWQCESSRLVIEISHGPVDDVPAGWINLYAATIPDRMVGANDGGDVDLLDCIAYGVELMRPHGPD